MGHHLAQLIEKSRQVSEQSLALHFRVGDDVLLVDKKKRRYILKLKPGGIFSSHLGAIPHDRLIGQTYGSRIELANGNTLIALKPTLAENILEMPRGAQVIYPKDLGAILIYADVFMNVSVLEAGVGSGALSMALLGCGATVTGYELREDFANRALKNVNARLGEKCKYSIELRDIYEGIDGKFDRIILDLPEPWKVIEHAQSALVPGGIFLSYLPTISQVVELYREFARIGASCFDIIETFEVMQRYWHVDGRSVRPEHRMVGHTGFIVSARLVSDSTSKDPSE